MKLKIILLFLLFICNCIFAKTTKSTSNGVKVFVIFSYLPGLWSFEAENGIKFAFKESNEPFEMKTYTYDYIRKRVELKTEISKIKELINSFNPQIIIIFDDEAADDLVPSLNELNIPIVTTGINKDLKNIPWYKVENDPKRNFTGVLEVYPFEESLKVLKRIDPKINSITILTSENDSSKIITNQIQEKFANYKNSFKGIVLNEIVMSKKWSVWQKKIVELNKKNEAFWILVPWNVLDDNNNEISLKIMGEFYQKNSKVPEIGIVSANSMFGFLACFSVSSEDLGYQAANIGITILKKKINPTNIPFQKVKTIRFTINKQRAKVLGFKIPIELLEFAHIEQKVPLENFR